MAREFIGESPKKNTTHDHCQALQGMLSSLHWKQHVHYVPCMAINRKCRLVTVDKRCINALADTPLGKHVCHVAKPR